VLTSNSTTRSIAQFHGDTENSQSLMEKCLPPICCQRKVQLAGDILRACFELTHATAIRYKSEKSRPYQCFQTGVFPSGKNWDLPNYGTSNVELHPSLSVDNTTATSANISAPPRIVRTTHLLPCPITPFKLNQLSRHHICPKTLLAIPPDRDRSP